VKVLFRAHKVDRVQLGAVRAHLMDDVHGPRFGYRKGGCVPLFMVELMVALPDIAGSCPVVFVSGWQIRAAGVLIWEEGCVVIERGSKKSGRYPICLLNLARAEQQNSYTRGVVNKIPFRI